MEMFINQRDDFDSVRIRRGALHSRRARTRKVERKKMNLKTGSLLNIFFYPHHCIYNMAWLDRGFTYTTSSVDMRIINRRENPKVGNKRKEVHPVLTYFFLVYSSQDIIFYILRFFHRRLSPSFMEHPTQPL
jgi:hypothetical protein